MNYINIEKFRAFLDENLKTPFGCYDFDACLADLERSSDETGSERYELAGMETKSGNPECISFSRSDRFFCDGKEVSPEDDWDEVQTTIEF